MGTRLYTKTTEILIYFAIWTLYALNCILYDRESLLGMAIGFIVSACIIRFLYLKIHHALSSFTTWIALLIIVLPVSFRSIFCTGYDHIPLPWFYIFLFIIMLSRLISLAKLNYVLTILLFLMIVPLLLSNNIIEGFKEYLGYASFCVGGIIAYLNKDEITKEIRIFLESLYINGVIFIALGVIVQYIALSRFGIELFTIKHYAKRDLLMFLFYDMSGNTVYMGTAVLMLLFSKIKLKYLKCLLITLGMTLTSARAGIIALFITIVLIIVFEKRKFINKLPLIIFCGGAGAAAVYILLSIRLTITSVNMLMWNNGRNELSIVALKKFIHSPFIGNGLDLKYQLISEGYMIPHNAILSLLAQMGIFIAAIYVSRIVKSIQLVKKSQNSSLFWCCILCAIGSLVSPSFFDLRFYTVIFMLCIITQPIKRKYIPDTSSFCNLDFMKQP